MLPLSLVTLGLAAICACSKPTVRTVGLEVSLSTPTDKVASVSDLRVVATVKNSGDEDLKILKLGTVLDNEHPTRSFIVSKGGKDVPFTGIMVRAYSPPHTSPCFSGLSCCRLINIHTNGLHRIRFPRTASPRMTGLSSPPERA